MLLQKIKLYAGRSPISRKVLWTAQQRRHFVLEILKAALRSRRGNRRRRRLGPGPAWRRLGGHWRSADTGLGRIAGRAPKGCFQPLRHLGQILIGRRKRR